MPGTTRSTYALILLCGCVGPGQLLRNCSGASSPDYSSWDSGQWDTAGDGAWDTAWDSGGSFSTSDCDVVLEEAGDIAGDELGEAQDLGTLSESELPYFVCGYTSDPGNDGSAYTGDRDLFSFIVGTSGTLYFRVEPLSATTDVDALVCDESFADCSGSATTSGEGNGETLSRSVTVGERVNLVVYGRSGDSANYYVRVH
jgi:hypothetical protein